MSQTDITFDEQYDLVVVGAGAAGLSAALTAIQTAEQSGTAFRVAVLERSDRSLRGGNTRWSGAYLRLESPTQPVSNLVEYAVDASRGYANRGYYEHLVASVPEAFEWLIEQGVVLEQLPTIFLTASATRYQPVGGGINIVEPLFARLEQTDATVLYETAAHRLLTDERNRVIGIQVYGPDGTPRTLGAGSVVLASGGFQGNRELMSRYVGKNAYRVPPISRGGANNRGDGLRMAMEVGAATEGQFDLFHAEPKDPRSEKVAEAVVMTFPYGILVNTRGERFFDEGGKTVDLTYEAMARTVLQEPDSIAYAVFDQQVKSIPGYEHAIGTDIDPISADSIEELERLLSLPEGALVRTVSEFNAACADGEFEWSRLDGLAAAPEGQPTKSNWARPLVEGPFFAYPQICANVFSFGGVKTDLEARVVTSDGHPVQGLYAAGEMTGLYYEAYAGSTSVMRSITFGRIAGRNAVSARVEA